MMRRTAKLASSIAHINGQKVVGAEAYTSEPESGRWQEYPFALKAVGDKAFTEGINRMVVHRYAMQPHSNAVPAMTLGPWEYTSTGRTLGGNRRALGWII